MQVSCLILISVGPGELNNLTLMRMQSSRKPAHLEETVYKDSCDEMCVEQSQKNCKCTLTILNSRKRTYRKTIQSYEINICEHFITCNILSALYEIHMGI
jgi:hypothetical protein